MRVSAVRLLLAHGLSVSLASWKGPALTEFTFQNRELAVDRKSVPVSPTQYEVKRLLTTTSHHTCLLSAISYSDSPNAVPSRCNPSFPSARITGSHHAALFPLRRGWTYRLSNLDCCPQHGPEYLCPVPIYHVRPFSGITLLRRDLRLSLRIYVPHRCRACTVAGDECSSPTADRHALPRKNNLSPSGSTTIHQPA